MAKSDWPREARDPGPFEPGLKCCTYEPFLPNFTLGRLLNEGIHGNRLERAFRQGRLSPLGLLPTRESAGSFGRDSRSRCAFLTDDAQCSIWLHRPSVCRSYFCVSNKGAAGQLIWQTAEKLGNEAEWTLAHELLWDLGFTQSEIEAETWAEWTDRKEDLLIETARRAFGSLTAP